jgi:CO dehydrogenase maturation factor
MPTPAGVHLLVMGTVKSMGSGCACPGNTVIRSLLRHLVVERDEAVVLDMEAGLEHLGRGTAEAVDWMLVVSDANRKSLMTAAAIADMARKAGITHVALVGNRVENEEQREIISTFASEHNLQLLGVVPFDAAVEESGIRGSPVMALEGTPAVRAIDEIRCRLTNREGDNS